MFIPRFALINLVIFATSVPTMAHEFWISPVNYVIEAGGQAQAHLRVGQEFKGSSYSFQTKQFDRFEMIAGDTTTPVTGRLGDLPALNMSTAGNGLTILVHETRDNQLTYREWAKFEKFVVHKAFPTVLEDHVVRGISQDEFVEQYRRYAKSLVAIGDGTGHDKQVGLKTEIVALANPYTEKLSAMPVAVFLDGRPRTDAQVELFDRAPDGEVTVTLHRTDADGKATFPVAAGHEYLVDAVSMLPLDNNDAAAGPVWWSLWASLTFAIPDAPL